ncbi:hypothetical protein EHRUM1_03040 [Ehrlichia ruminantium]|nr:hypothetical protein EHRUM1_03040 [Ehrlichia ruminantium]
MLDLSVNIRYLKPNVTSANFIDIPNIPISTIHKTAPGPPVETAITTPDIVPNPIVPDIAVINACILEIVLLDLLLDGLIKMYKACLKSFILINLNLKVQNIPRHITHKIIKGILNIVKVRTESNVFNI